MSAEFIATVPTRGDGQRGDWEPSGPARVPAHTDPRPGAYGPFDHLEQIGRAAEVTGWDGVLVPFDPAGEESLVVTAGLLRRNRWLRGVAGFHPGVATPVYAAKVSASLQRFSGGRLDWLLSVDLDPATARAQGDFTEGPERYARAEEFLTIAKGVWREEDYTYEGRHFQVLAGGFQAPLAEQPFPRVFLSGTSAEALDLSALHADVHLFDAYDDLDTLIPALGERAASRGRTVAYGLRLPVLAREDDDEARTALGHRGTVPASALVGAYGHVAEALRAHERRGVATFVLEASPYVEEAYRLGENLIPLLRRDGREDGGADPSGRPAESEREREEAGHAG
ncbi:MULTISPECIES: LLM class flavin-dependent oxidoreductase [Actinomadura]|uniref:LLM class flavin-dependent oxidoreductase n=1 Tax=Actinomadura yumaensis TaxID=111807 RepID=A0ABW2CWM1_9ACTN|nr:LLM class flavin-dependent oxidoreductase [Actinomadura sp. J1-007]MWK39633.1 LLM class flavin-dependent oxidoreductase [Actinomadura sp. J1-007]